MLTIQVGPTSLTPKPLVIKFEISIRFSFDCKNLYYVKYVRTFYLD